MEMRLSLPHRSPFCDAAELPGALLALDSCGKQYSKSSAARMLNGGFETH